MNMSLIPPPLDHNLAMREPAPESIKSATSPGRLLNPEDAWSTVLDLDANEVVVSYTGIIVDPDQPVASVECEVHYRAPLRSASSCPDASWPLLP